jgi:hypothetical protein
MRAWKMREREDERGRITGEGYQDKNQCFLLLPGLKKGVEWIDFSFGLNGILSYFCSPNGRIGSSVG